MSSDFTSRTARVPTRHYKRRYAVSRHALERFRERVDEEFRHRDDDDLGNLLDERICHAESNYQVRDPHAPEEITTLRSVACRHATYYAVVRGTTVVTVLDEKMARDNFNGKWTPVMHTPFEVLRDLKIPPPAPTPLAASEPPPVAADPLAEAGAAYARARRRRHECTDAVAARKDELEHATEALARAAEALREAELSVEEAHKRLIGLAEGAAE